MLNLRIALRRSGIGIAALLLSVAAKAQAPSISVNNTPCAGATAAITYGGATGVTAINIQTNGCGTVQTPTAPTITSGTPTATASVGAPYSFQFMASGTSPISWSLGSNPNLPPGITLSTSGLLSGTPTAGGTPPFTFSVVAGNGTAPNANAGPFTITVNNNPAITSNAPPAATVNTAYSHTFTASQTSPAITWGLSSGSNPLPAWVTLNPSTGVLSGTPSVSNTGTSTFVVQATNTNGSGTQNVSLTVNPAGVAPTITTATPPSGTVNSAYTYTFGASGSAPITWGSTGTLPTGLTLNPTTGTLSGTPSAQGMFSFTITATNGTMPNAATGTLTVSIGGISGSAFDTSLDDGVIPTPSKYPNVIPPFRNGKLNGAGQDINAYAAELQSCSASNSQLGTNAGIVRRWQHNIDFGDHQVNQGIDYVAMAPRESLTYMFTAPTTQGVQRIQFQRDTSATWVPVMMSLSQTPCDFDQTKLTPANRNYCYVADNNIYYQMTNGSTTAPYCALRPGTKYYLNIRFLRTADLNNDPCSLTPSQRCGGVLQVQ